MHIYYLHQVKLELEKKQDLNFDFPVMTSKLLIQLQTWLLLAAALTFVVAGAKAKSPSHAKPGCNDTCGGVGIPYPFGMGASNCFVDPWFEIECRASATNHSRNGSNSTPFLSKLNLELLEVVKFTHQGYYDQQQSVKVRIPPLSMCSTTAHTHSPLVRSIDFSGSPYTFTTKDNVFMMDGCPGSAVLVNQSNIATAGCGTACGSIKNSASSCFGVNCCQTPLSTYLSIPFYEIDFILRPSQAHYCLVATLIQRGSVNEYVGKLSSSDAPSFPPAPVVLSWSWPNNIKKPRNHRNASCYGTGRFWHCQCRDNYDGNPYLPDGCRPKECEVCRGECFNQQDSSGKDIPNTYYCENVPLIHPAAVLGLSCSIGFLLLVACLYGLYRFIKRRREMRRRAKFFKRNGGLLLQQQLSSSEGIVERTKIFTVTELDKATDHFNQNRILGQGGQGTVYKGMLTDGSIVAIKKAKLLDETQLEQFINEVVILSRINHRHVVKLFGCCLETEVPLLVYEFIPNGTLYEHIHDPDEDFVVSWEMRLKNAADSASAIAYLHSSSSFPIYHRDIKSSNILLDEKYRAKVSDFGSSKTIAIDQTHLTTLVQGTIGYLDPEYFQSYQFTEKSDVYSFGVVILELLTSRKPIYRDGSSMEQKNLVTEFLFLTQDSRRLSSILDPKIVEEAKEDELVSVVELAKRCVSWSGKMRPTMREVAMTLEMIMKSPAQVCCWYQQQGDFPIQYAGYDEFDMAGVSDAECSETSPLLSL